MKKRKKPPDLNPEHQKKDFRTIKCPINLILKHPNIIKPKIERLVVDFNQLVVQTNLFLKAFLLKLFHEKKPFPIIDKEFIKNIMRVITYNANKGKTEPKNAINIEIKKQIKEFYDKEFNQCLNDSNTISSVNRSHLIEETAKQILTCLITNLSTHFRDYINKYINLVFRNDQKQTIKSSYRNDEKKQLLKTLYNDVRNIKIDFFNGNDQFNDSNYLRKSPSKYHQWIHENQKRLLPDKILHNLVYDCKVKPNIYLYYAFEVNDLIESTGHRPYQVIPQRSSIVPKQLVINTSALVDFLHDSSTEIFKHGKTEMMSHCCKYQNYAWSQVLKLENKKIFNHGGYIFHNQITTDGVSCSVLFRHKDCDQHEKVDNLLEQHIDGCKQLTDLNPVECLKYLDSNKYKLLGLDPGKNSLVTISSGDPKRFYEYSCGRRWNDSYAKRSLEIILNEKQKTVISSQCNQKDLKFKPGNNKPVLKLKSENNKPFLKLKSENNLNTLTNKVVLKLKSQSIDVIAEETKLSQFNSRTLNQIKYLDYATNKIQTNQKLQPFYNRELFRKLALRRFIRTRQSEDKMLNEIENFFLTKLEKMAGKKLLIGYGNWSRSSQMKGFMSTPGLGLRRLISQRFEIKVVDEYNTSKYACRANNLGIHEQLCNIKMLKDDRLIKVHEILTLKRDPNSGIYVNRDHNASENIRLVLLQHLKSQTRPLHLRRPGSTIPPKLLDDYTSDSKAKLKILLKSVDCVPKKSKIKIQLKKMT